MCASRICNAMRLREEKTTGSGSAGGGGWEKSLKINIMQPARFLRSLLERATAAVAICMDEEEKTLISDARDTSYGAVAY